MAFRPTRRRIAMSPGASNFHQILARPPMTIRWWPSWDRLLAGCCASGARAEFWTRRLQWPPGSSNSSATRPGWLAAKAVSSLAFLVVLSAATVDGQWSLIMIRRRMGAVMMMMTHYCPPEIQPFMRRICRTSCRIRSARKYFTPICEEVQTMSVSGDILNEDTWKMFLKRWNVCLDV